MTSLLSSPTGAGTPEPSAGTPGLGPASPVASAGDGPRPSARAVVARAAALAVALAAAAGVWVTWRAFVDTAVGQAVEKAAYAGASYGQNRLWQVGEPILEVVSIPFVVLGAAVAILVALLRRRWAQAIQALVLVAGANLTTQVLKYGYFERPALGGDGGANSLPSGHTTVAASFAAALLLTVPRRARPLVAVLGAGYTAATGVSTLIGQWHRPSDAIAAILVVLAWTVLVCALGPASATDPPGADARTGSGLAVGFLGLGALVTALPAAWGLREAYLAASAGAAIAPVQTYVAGALGVSAAAASAFAVMLLIRQSTARPR